MWYQIVFGILVLILLYLVRDRIDKLVTTLRRLESRLTLLSPLETERKPLEQDAELKHILLERALQPDVWEHIVLGKLEEIEKREDVTEDLRETKLKNELKRQRSIFKRYRRDFY